MNYLFCEIAADYSEPLCDGFLLAFYCKIYEFIGCEYKLELL